MWSLLVIENNCNQKCVFCSALGRTVKIDLKTIAKEIITLGNYIQISWWEPLVNKDVFMVLALIRKLKPQAFIEFQSNALLLLKNNNLEKLLKWGVNLFNINYPSHIDEINDKIVWKKDTLHTREESISALIENKAKVRLTVIINQYNYSTLPETIQHITTKFPQIERIQLSFVKGMWWAKNKIQIIPKYEDVSPFIINALEQAEKSGIKIDIDHIPPCYLGRFFTNHVDYKKIILWETWDFMQEKKQIAKCKDCKQSTYCSGYRKDYLDIYPMEHAI